MTNNVFRLSTSFVLLQVIFGLLHTKVLCSGNGLKIWPNLTSFTLSPDTPEENRSLICKGTESVRWYFRQYDGTLQIKKNFSIKVFTSGENRPTYLSLLSLNKATYLDTGYYVCAPSEKLQYFKEIYIFVQHKTHLLAIPEDFKLLYDLKNETVLVPNRPTSPDVNVTIKSDVKYQRKYWISPALSYHPNMTFNCNNGQSLNGVNVCDGKKDCSDGSDEDKTFCQVRMCNQILDFECPSNQNDTCLWNYYVCDGVAHCVDGSDEDENLCKARTCHPYKPFKCSNGPCLNDYDVCNGKKDCKDGGDEDETMCQVVKKCNMQWQFKCTDFNEKNMSGCMMDVNACDGIHDCRDGSDENPTMCKARTCVPERPFKCTNGRCLAMHLICDGTKQCNDGSDEDESMCKKLGHMRFNDRTGFQLIYILPFINTPYTSTARKFDITDNRSIPNPFDHLLHINDSSSRHVVIGNNLTLNCSIDPRARSLLYTLKWRVPVILGNKLTRHEQVGKEQHVLLYNIRNVSTDDDGDYICVATSTNGMNYTKTYKLNSYPFNANYVYLRINDSVQKKIRPVGYESVQWIVAISANQNLSLKWMGPNGKKLETKSEIKCVENINCVSELSVTNSKLSDSGIYTLVAYNEAELKEINVTLLVEEKPKVLFIKGLESSQSYYEVGKTFTFVFYISGYPLPSVEWTFEKCPNYPECDQSDSETKGIESEIIQISAIALKLVIRMNVTDTGTLICNSSNILGNHARQHTILVTDTSNGFEIRGPPVILTGHNITLECYASIYNYLNEIKWNYPVDTQTRENLTISNSKTTFSYRSQLMITNVSKHFNGYVNCTINRQTNDEQPTETETKSFNVYVEDPQVPVINNSSDTNRVLIVADYGKQVILQCYAIGTPHPTISWFKEDQPWPFGNNYSRVSVQSGNQSILVNYTEVENGRTYKCIASNEIGSTVLSYKLQRNNTNNLDQTVSIVVLCSVIAILLLLLGILVFGYVLCHKKKKTMKNTTALIEMDKLEEGADKSVNPNLDIQFHWSFSIEKLKLGKRLGSGAFGVVYKAKATGIIRENTTTDVAVKTVNPNTVSSCIKILETEIKMMINIGKHLNILNILGLCTGNEDKQLMLIVEYCRYGSIDRYMKKYRECFVNEFISDVFMHYDGEPNSKNNIYENVNNDTKISEDNDNLVDAVIVLSNDKVSTEGHSNNDGNIRKQIMKPLRTLNLIQWSYQVAKGMDFLASKNILHGDLAARNILLGSGNIVKICDFGLSKSLSNSGVYRKKSKQDLLPIKWMSIESLRDLVFSTQSDVWSFGVVMWEMFSLAATPYPNLQLNDLYNKLKLGYRMEKPKYANSIIYNMMMDCWETEPIRRPSFTDLTIRLGDLLQECTKSDYVDLGNNLSISINETNPISPISPATASSSSNYCFSFEYNEIVTENGSRTSNVH